ncbi:hypothetical protein COX94_01015 [Candidatus Nomurabacteria bacterium CG_4_10_14_0_2_um_filter_33_9]|uniref:Methyltransferase type 11 domain-containing protein n=1 Tax=Candidatus Nomurabacteria bacterium CG_4_10_14_0_2_um_filter_33_9 TaxID=1974728 RepID=A0A2J0MEA5_9BACT|nr:MAG: hypothetical protein COX94_01015 [Candidatus Nomurabacteria bacterium CG_4_10_14_0_2_um_filter_33_9]
MNKHEISSSSSLKNLTEVWENVYGKKTSINTAQRREKHLIYYETLIQLGFFSDLPDNSLVVQGGCGHGSAVRLMTDLEEKSNIFPVGIDLSRIALNTARSVNNLNVLQGDVAKLPLRTSIVDRYFEVGVVEHFYRDGILIPRVDRPLIVKSFMETMRVMKKGGLAAFIQPSYRSFGMVEHRIRDAVGKWDMGFQEDFLVEDFIQLMELGGFENINFAVIPASGDLPKIINLVDGVAKNLVALCGQHLLAENIGMFFVAIGQKL